MNSRENIEQLFWSISDVDQEGRNSVIYEINMFSCYFLELRVRLTTIYSHFKCNKVQVK